MSSAQAAPRRGALAPLYAAGFVTAFGAHAVAANLGRYGAGDHTSLLELGVLLAVYDGAEVVLKPVFGSVSDRIGPRLVLLGGLIGFAFASAGFVIAGKPAWLGIARLAQGASAAAFSPAAAALVAGLGGTKRRGRSFGGYGSFKGLGYLAGPVVGGALVVAGGYPLLFVVLAALAAGVALVCFWQVPVVAPVARSRETLVGLVRRLGQAEFAWPVVALAAVTGALSAGIGFLPVAGARAGLGALVTGVVVSVMAAAVILVQPRAGQAFDDGRLSVGTGLSWGIGLCGIGLVLAAVFHGVAPLTSAAALIGLGVGVATPLGFAALAAAAPEGRMGQTMGAAEVGRELGDAGGPLVVGGLALFSLTAGLAGLGVLCGAIAVLLTRISTPASTQPEVAN